MVKVLYSRISSITQNMDRQLVEADKYDKVYEDVCSGKNADRPALKEMIGFLREGDSLYVHELSRLARNTFDLIDLVNQLLAKGVQINFIKENLHFSPNQEDATSNLMLTIFGAVAQFEREILKIRQKEGIILAKAKGKFKGTKKRLSAEQINELKELAQNKSVWTVAKLRDRYRISRASVYNYLKL